MKKFSVGTTYVGFFFDFPNLILTNNIIAQFKKKGTVTTLNTGSMSYKKYT